jgi:hypothetical protein
MIYLLLSDDDSLHANLSDLQSQLRRDPESFQYQYLNIDINLISAIKELRINDGLKKICFFADSLLADNDFLNIQDSYKVININQLDDKTFDLLLTDEKGVLINLDSFEKNSYLLTSLEVLDRADIDGFNRLDPSYREEILKRISELLKIQLNIFAEENNAQDIFYVHNYKNGQAVKFLKYEYRSIFDELIQENKSLISQAIQRQASPSSSKLDDHFNSLDDSRFNKFLPYLDLINLESPEENSHLISSLKDPIIFGDDNFERLPREARNEILRSINNVVKLRLETYSEDRIYNNIFYVRNYQDGSAVKFLRPEYSDLIKKAVKENKSNIAIAFKKIIDSFSSNKDMPSDRIIDNHVDDLSDKEFRELLRGEEAILINLDSPRDNQRLLALLKDKDIFGEQNFDRLNPAVKIAFLNQLNEILKTSLELYAQNSAGVNPFYVRNYSDGTKAKFLKYEHFNLIDEIINQNKELIATSIKSILQQSTSQSSNSQPRVLAIKPFSTSLPDRPRVLETSASLQSLHQQPMVLETKPVSTSSPSHPRVLKTTPVKELISQFNNPPIDQKDSPTSSVTSSTENITPSGSISPRIAEMKEFFEKNKKDSSNSPSSVVESPRSFYESQSTTNRPPRRL